MLFFVQTNNLYLSFLHMNTRLDVFAKTMCLKQKENVYLRG